MNQYSLFTFSAICLHSQQFLQKFFSYLFAFWFDNQTSTNSCQVFWHQGKYFRGHGLFCVGNPKFNVKLTMGKFGGKNDIWVSWMHDIIHDAYLGLKSRKLMWTMGGSPTMVIKGVEPNFWQQRFFIAHFHTKNVTPITRPDTKCNVEIFWMKLLNEHSGPKVF